MHYFVGADVPAFASVLFHIDETLAPMCCNGSSIMDLKDIPRDVTVNTVWTIGDFVPGCCLIPNIPVRKLASE